MTVGEERKIRAMMKEKGNLDLGLEYIANLGCVVVFVRDDSKDIGEVINVMYKENALGGIDSIQLEFKCGALSSTIRADVSKYIDTLLNLLYQKNHLVLFYVNNQGDIHSLREIENDFSLSSI